jgi:hypothetical protein
VADGSCPKMGKDGTGMGKLRKQKGTKERKLSTIP